MIISPILERQFLCQIISVLSGSLCYLLNQFFFKHAMIISPIPLILTRTTLQYRRTCFFSKFRITKKTGVFSDERLMALHPMALERGF